MVIDDNVGTGCVTLATKNLNNIIYETLQNLTPSLAEITKTLIHSSCVDDVS